MVYKGGIIHAEVKRTTTLVVTKDASPTNSQRCDSWGDEGGAVSPSGMRNGETVQATMHWFPPLVPPVSRSVGTSSCPRAVCVEKTLKRVEKASISELGLRQCGGGRR